MHLSALLATCTALLAGAAGTPTQLKAVYVPREAQQQDSRDMDPKYVIGEVIASEFDRHVPVLSDNLRGELNTLRNDISRQFDSLKHHMDVKLDRMQRDAPAMEDTRPGDPRPRPDSLSAATPAATIRHNLAMAELRRLSAELTRSMNEELATLREEFRASLEHLREQVQNSTDGLAERLGDEFSAQAEESTAMLKKVFFLTRSQMTLIQNTLRNITLAITANTKPDATPSPQPAESVDEAVKGTSHLPPLLSTLTDTSTEHQVFTTTTVDDGFTTTTAPDTTTTTTTSTTTEPKEIPRDCMEAPVYGMTRSGVAKIRPSPEMEPKKVWCEQEVEGGGWTVMLWRKKQATQIDFRRSWQSYAEGFGAPDGEYWIGLEALYKLTKGNPYNLRVEMTWEDEEAVSLYDFFSVGPARAGYRGYELNVGGYNKTSTGGDAMEYHNGMDFSTYDQDNDGASGGSCSEWSGGGGWWFNYCYYSNPTGIYPPSDLPPNTQVDHLIEWRKWQGYYTYLSTFRMLIRPN